MMTNPKKRTDRTTRKATAGRGRKGRLDVPSAPVRRRRIDAGTTSRPYGVSPSPQGVRMPPTLAAGPAAVWGGVDYWQSMSKGGVENGVPIGRRGDCMAHRIRIRDIKGGSRHGKGMRRPLRTAIAVIVATAMLTPTIASAAPVVSDTPSPVPGVESSSPYADDGVTYTADGRPLYESASDTIYIYNALQTAVARQEDAADQPVLTGDGDAETFGTGQPIYAEDSDEPLTYSPEHTYVYVDGWNEGLEDAGENNNVVVSDDLNSADKNEEAEKDEAADSTSESEPAEKGDASDDVELRSDEPEAYNSLSGRDYVGQVTKTIGDTTYILIGNEQQLRAIGSDKPVIGGPVYRIAQKYHAPGGWKDEEGASPELLYPGDADLDDNTGLRGENVPSGSSWDGGRRYRYYLDINGSQEDVDKRVNTDLTYASDANYIIFRDIDLSGIDWEPLMFSGTMIGAKASAESNIWDTNATEIVATDKPVISNVTVRQDSPLNIEEHYGIGFFGTISNKVDASYNLGIMGVGASYDITVKPARVENIKLSDVDVSTLTSEHVKPTSLIEELLGQVSTVLGGVLTLLNTLLKPILAILHIPNLTDLLKTLITSLVTNAAADPSYFATGSFAGRVVGDVTIIGCEVENASVDNQNDISGGFVGYSAGDTEYEGLSDLLGAIVVVLSGLLNVIPGLGLGDLIDILLGQEGLLPVGSLIPAKYSNPTFENNAVYLANGETIGRSNTAQNGGFFGAQIGTVAKNNTVATYQPEGSAGGSGSYTVLASRYAGGFSGLSRNDVLKGTLSADTLGIALIRVSHPQSLTEGCKVDANVTVTAGDYAGGFSGALSNSFGVNDEITGAVTVTAKAYTYTDPHDSDKTTTGTYAGGYTGIATLGWKSNLGASDTSDDKVTLLSLLKETLVELLTKGDAKSGDLLSLVGIDESGILGLELRGATSVSADGGYAGGIVGSGDGLMIAASDTEHLNKIGFYKSKIASDFGQAGAGFAHPDERLVSVEALSSVTAGTEGMEADYAGGIAGKLGTASVGGVLNSTVGIGGYLPFEVSEVTVTGVSDGYRVSATGDAAGGGIGEATGGTVGGDSRSDGSGSVLLENIALVSANSRAGGLAGVAGPGDLVGTGGLDLLGLVKIDGLLSVAEGVEVEARNVRVSGIEAGMRVEATGAPANEDDRSVQYIAGGFIGKANSVRVADSYVENLLSVKASDESGYAGGFVGTSVTGGLADVSDKTALEGLASIGSILNLVGYLIPEYSNIYVSYTDDGGVEADVAGGFAGDFQSGFLNTVQGKDSDQIEYVGQKPSSGEFVVYNIDHVTGNRFAGGFGGRVTSGGLASSGGQGGLSILDGLNLSINASDLLSLVAAYVPMLNYAGVSSAPKDGDTDDGFVVRAKTADEGDSVTGAAGGYIGYASGVQVGYSDVASLRHTTVVPPEDLEGKEAQSYFTDESSYAVTAPRYAGGYFGLMDIGDAASVGSGLKLLGQTLLLNHLLSALSVVVSTAEHSDVNGQSGGYSVLASGTENGGAIGHAGGFAGMVLGGHIQDANAYNFEYVIGQESAGGYAGTVAPGNLADVLGSSDVLGGLVSTDDTLAQVAGDFVPSIRNSETTCVPCGGAVRAQALSDAGHLRGMAGGYVGHNQGGQISGNNTDRWKYEAAYSGPTREAAAVRIRSVYGAEFAGGFTGLMHPGDTANTGNLSLLWGLVKVGNLLSALPIAYPTEENTAVYGPLANLDYETWNSWVDFVGKYGGYGADLAETGKVENQDELDAKLDSYVYGFHAVAGRDALALASEGEEASIKGGSAGGYVGTMIAGTVTNGQAHDAKLVRGMRAAGGFAGVAEAGGAAELGSVSILGNNLNLGQLLEAAEVFVPVIKNSSVEGYRLGMTVASQGAGSRSDDISHATGNAGGYIGYGAGVQIWGDGTTELGELVEVEGGSAAQDAQAAEKGDAAGCNVANLRRVVASAYAGGYAGRLTSGSTANVNTDGVSDGFIQKLLDTIIGNTGLTNLVSVLQATMSTVRGASVSAADEGWGFTVEAYRTDEKTTYPLAAGGFVGLAQATVMGERDAKDSGNEAASVTVNDLRGVEGGLYSGGFVGLAETGGVAEVAGGTGEGSSTSLLDILKLGSVEVIQAFQPFIYDGTVNGVADGVVVSAHTWDEGGLLGSKRMSGNAGGFAGTIMGGEVLRGTANNMNSVSAPNYAGGFVGYTGKTGIADVEDVSALEQLGNILGLTAGVANVIGTTVEDSTVTGIPGGYTVASQGTAGTAPESGADSAGTGEQIAGGFAGYADLAHITNCDAGNLKLVRSAQAAGGFAGKTSFAYLISAEADSALLNAVLSVLDQLVKLLYLDDLQNLDAIKINLLGQTLSLDVLSDGNVLTVWLLGIKISVSLAQGSDKHDDIDDFVNVTIGDSQIQLSCNKNGIVWSSDDDKAEVTVNLIKGNRSEVTDCSVTGIAAGYDVFGGGATQASAGSGASGYAGGFVGHNNEGKLTGNKMLYADVVSGTADMTGPFTGSTSYSSTYWFNSIEDIDQNNTYHVYRDTSLVGANVEGTENMNVATGAYDTGVPGDATEATAENASWARFDVTNHKPVVGSNHADWENATVAPAGGEKQDLEVYVSAAKAKLMDDTAVSDNTGGLTPEPGDGQDPCAARVNVTIQKVWNDGGDSAGTRPESIKVKLTATYTDKEGATVTPDEIWFTDEKGEQVGEAISNPMTITLTKNDDVSNWTETWRKVVENLPVAFVDEDGELHYYTYTASEVKDLSDDYLVSYETDSKENVITITNSLPLPETGGMGTHWFAILGVLIVGVGILLTRKDTYGRGTGRHRAAR